MAEVGTTHDPKPNLSGAVHDHVVKCALFGLTPSAPSVIGLFSFAMFAVLLTIQRAAAPLFGLKAPALNLLIEPANASPGALVTAGTAGGYATPGQPGSVYRSP